MNKDLLIIASAAVWLSIPAPAALQSDGAGIVARFMETVRADPVLFQAARQNQSGAAASAIPALLSYTKKNPQIAEGWYLLSMAYGDTGQKDLANAAIRRATAIKPELDDMTNYLARRMDSSPAAPAAQRATAARGTNEANQARSAPRPTTGRASSGSENPVPGTHLCWSARISEFMAEDSRQSQASSGPMIVPDRIIQSISSGSPALKYLVRADGTFADVTWGAKYAGDAKYNGRYAVSGGLVRLTVQGTPLYTFRRGQGSDGTHLLVQVREGKPSDPYVSHQVCRLTNS